VAQKFSTLSYRGAGFAMISRRARPWQLSKMKAATWSAASFLRPNIGTFSWSNKACANRAARCRSGDPEVVSIGAMQMRSLF